ncbi:MAG: hypothetical protein VCA36_12820 [Opitutales bacterium]
MLSTLLFVTGGLFVLLLLRILIRERRLAAIKLSLGSAQGDYSRDKPRMAPVALSKDRVEARQETVGEGDSEGVLQYVPLGSNKSIPVGSKTDPSLKNDDSLLEVLLRVEKQQKKILFYLRLVSSLAFVLIVWAGLHFYFQGQ